MGLALPREPSESGGLNVHWGRQVVRYLRSITPVSSPNILYQTTPNGTSATLNASSPPGSSAAAASTAKAFDITVTSQALPSVDFDINVRAGTLNSYVPDSLLTPVTYVTGTTIYVKIRALTNGKAVTSASLVCNTTAPAVMQTLSGSGPTAFDVLIGVVFSSSNVVKTWGGGNIAAALSQQFLEDKASPTAGQSIYNRWYTWTISVQS